MKNSKRGVQPRGVTMPTGKAAACAVVCLLCLAAFLLPKHAVNTVFLSEFRLDKFFKAWEMLT